MYYIEHHGILGMKWGVRRFQNTDGSYTKAGRKRYALDLDVNDKRRQNIAKIRTGEAKRRLDVAKSNNETNRTRIAELQGRVRSAKRNERIMKKVDKGAERAAKGETITGNKYKMLAASGAAYIGSRALTGFLNMRRAQLMSEGRWTAGHQYVAEMINAYGGHAMSGLAMAYNIKKSIDNSNIRTYETQTRLGNTSIKRVGSSEYSDRVKSKRK